MKGALATTALLAYAVGYTGACPDHLDTEPFVPAFWLSSLRNSTVADISPAAKFSGEPMRLIRFAEGATPVPMTESEVLQLVVSRKARFFDVTDQDLEVSAKNALHQRDIEARAIPTTPSQQTKVNAAIAQLSQSNLKTYVDQLAAFNNRYYTQATGASAATAIFNRLNTIASGKADVTVTRFTHSWTQNSIIARIEGSSTNQEVTIAGAHLDSIAGGAGARAPGADDDASGCANLIEGFRALVAANYKPATPIEFHFYAAEEVGLRGSQAIAQSYLSNRRVVKAMMNLDMTAYVKPGLSPTIGFVTDRTTPALTAFGKRLVSTYVGAVTVSNDACGYGCSDHSSWNAAGYPTVYPFEAITSTQNNLIHSSGDTTSVAGWSYEHMHRFSKLLVAYMIELST